MRRPNAFVAMICALSLGAVLVVPSMFHRSSGSRPWERYLEDATKNAERDEEWSRRKELRQLIYALEVRDSELAKMHRDMAEEQWIRTPEGAWTLKKFEANDPFTIDELRSAIKELLQETQEAAEKWNFEFTASPDEIESLRRFVYRSLDRKLQLLRSRVESQAKKSA